MTNTSMVNSALTDQGADYGWTIRYSQILDTDSSVVVIRSHYITMHKINMSDVRCSIRGTSGVRSALGTVICIKLHEFLFSRLLPATQFLRLYANPRRKQRMKKHRGRRRSLRTTCVLPSVWAPGKLATVRTQPAREPHRKQSHQDIIPRSHLFTYRPPPSCRARFY